MKKALDRIAMIALPRLDDWELHPKPGRHEHVPERLVYTRTAIWLSFSLLAIGALMSIAAYR